jgi:predicted tellurium resistance membrane protein TerC
VSERRRASLTPLESELRFQDLGVPHPPSAWRRARRRFRREQRPPATLLGAITTGVLRLALAVGIASLVALLADHWLGRQTALGFYIVGSALLAVALGTSAGTGRRYYTDQCDRERRVSRSFSYVLAGLAVIAIGVAVEATR